MSERKKEPEVQTWVHWLLIIIGVILLVGGALYLPGSLRERVLPQRVVQAVRDAGITAEISGALGLTSGFHLMVYGVFAIIAGVGLFGRRAWAWGMAVMILSIILVINVYDIVTTTIRTGGYDPVLQLLPSIAALAALVAWCTLMRRRKAYSA